MSEFWWGLIWLTIFIPFMFLWAFCLWDIFSRQDLKGWEKALWAVAIVFLPILGMLVYFIARPKELNQYGGYGYGDPYAVDPYGRTYNYQPGYDRASGPAPAATDMEAISRMHESGTLSDDEFNQLKDRMASQGPPPMPGQQSAAGQEPGPA